MNNILKAFGILAILATATLASEKPDPSGIIRLFDFNMSNPENSSAWTDPSLDGMRIRPDWDEVQPNNASTYQWSAIDAVMNLGTQHGKTIGMSVAAGAVTPQWVYDAGATKYALQDGSGLSMPIPWDATFQTKWFAFVRAMGQRYDANPALGYIVISGLGQYVETGLAETSADIAALTALGGPTAWVQAAEQTIAVYAEAFPTTPFFITAAKPFDNADGIAALQQVIDWGVATYPGRFGIMNASLNAHSDTTYYPNLAIYTYHTTQPVGLQMLCGSSDSSRLGGTLDQALAQGVLLGANFVEIYPEDADNPSNQTMLAIQGAALTANLGVRTPGGPLLNVSTRLQVGTADRVLIGGFIVNGSGTKKLMLRAIGPSLSQAGLTGALADPTLELHDSSGATIATNDNWQTTQIGGIITSNQLADISASRLAPADPAESAIIATLDPGSYTVIVRGVNNTTGIGLVEVYDLEESSPAKLANISTRGFVQTADNAMIGGFIVGAPDSPKVIVRALGPSLAASGVTDVLADPTLELHDGNGALIASNDNWADTQQTEIEATGLAPPDPLEAAIVWTVTPGNYTAIVTGKAGTIGVGLVEVYKIQ